MSPAGRRRTIEAGARRGALTGLAYATVECGFAALVPWLTEPSHSYHGVSWSFSAFLFVFYPAAGALLTAVVAGALAVLPRRGKESTAAVAPGPLATLVLATLFGVSNLMASGFRLDAVASATVAAALAAAAIASLRSAAWRDSLRPFIHPVSASLLLVGQPWVAEEIAASSTAVKGIVAVAYLVLATLLSWIVLRRSGPPAPRRIAVAALLVLAVSAWPEQTQRVSADPRVEGAAADRPSVVLIVLDTVRADHLSLYGYDRDTSPNLAVLARDAMVYRRAVSASNMTLPSHASLFSGLYVRQHGAGYTADRPAGYGLNADIVTLAEFLGAGGYRTIGVAANFPVLGHGYGLARGFQLFDERAPVSLLARSRPLLIRSHVRALAAAVLPPSIAEVEYRNAGEITATVVDAIAASRHDDRPLFVFANYMDAHWPYHPPAPFDTRFAGRLPGYRTADYFALRREVLARQVAAPDEVREHLISQYDGGIAYMDAKIGELMQYLRDEGLYEESLIIVTSDHGEAFGVNGEINHGTSVAQHQIGVPLIIKYPGATRVGGSDAAVGAVDIFPTVVDALDVEIPEGLAGTSLYTETPSTQRAVVSESYPEVWLRRSNPRFDHVERALVVGSLKLVSSDDGQMRLFDLARDPEESEDLFSTGTEGADLAQRMAQWLELHPPVQGSAVTLDARTLQRLKALGYVH